MPRALVVEDDASLLESVVLQVKAEGFEVEGAGTLAAARRALAKEMPDLVITDLGLPDGNGIQLIEEVREFPQTDVIVVTGQATVESAVHAMRLGALDYLEKPLEHERLKTVLSHLKRARELKQEVGSLRGELRKLGRFGPMIGSSPQMQHVYDLITRVAPTEAPVFITGESGTGKELVAQTIHELSRRSKGRFLPLNCGAMPPTLIESELFGHEKGSFTGATQQRRGYFERSSGGTLFLDEITEMPLELQVKLLRVLETGAVMRVGGDQAVAIDIRVLAATNRRPEEAVESGKLREDLLYRLNVFPIALPPIRERGGDVVMLAEYFLHLLNQENGTERKFSDTAKQRLQTHPWPGNARELKNEVQRAFILSDDTVDFDHLSSDPGAGSRSTPSSPSSIRAGISLADAERQLIMSTLQHCSGDKRKAAEILGISLKTLYNRLHLYNASAV
ncbi:MAG: sigma-54-dependent transcriptional regulator [Candidatus Eiseniibacteriota bacterium]